MLRAELERLARRELSLEAEVRLAEVRDWFAAQEPAPGHPDVLGRAGAVLGFVALGRDAGEHAAGVGLAVPWVAEPDEGSEDAPLALATDAVAARLRARRALFDLVQAGFGSARSLLLRLLEARCGPRLRGFEGQMLRGDSLGLVHFAALFSWVFDLPAAPQLAVAGALASHDPSFATDGPWGALGGYLLKSVTMQAKVRALLLDAPWVRGLVLPASNARALAADPELGPALAARGITLHPVRDLLELVEATPLFNAKARAARLAPPRSLAPAAGEVHKAGPWPLAVSGEDDAVAARCEACARGFQAVFRFRPGQLLPYLRPADPLTSLLACLRARVPRGSLFGARLELALAAGEVCVLVHPLRPGAGAAVRAPLFAALGALAAAWPRCGVLLGCRPGLGPEGWRHEPLAHPAEDFDAWLDARLAAAVPEERRSWIRQAAEDLACATSLEAAGVPERRLLKAAAARSGRSAAERALELLERWGVLARHEDERADAVRVGFVSTARQASLAGRALAAREDAGAYLRALAGRVPHDAALLLAAAVEAACALLPAERGEALRATWEAL